MATIRYTKEHEWLRIDDSVATVGISDHAQEQLGEIVFVDLPDAGKSLSRNEDMAVVESVKAASDVYAPISGEVVEINETLADNPAQVNDSPEDKGWFVKLKIANPAELDDLMDADAYQQYLETLG
ncbi:MAG: glycine cleavage system protein GcvH [Alphaproteobacteria bacterium]|nr:glycine cleavage system protein GcvH [Alphaproteobacteria bacterium]